ncbi:hypothetical protein EFL95_13770 [Nocardioides marmorisolisilvae]|uniref:Ig-like domain repeat protein n=1 Tax=Nocardioides marmorisolisilvae TaxID=1542737 RepID=A0A3N0DWJ6_9ACTN|nr:hypothetical protein EFL95_13770 [Nocardioides marmorisolisilvae]
MTTFARSRSRLALGVVGALVLAGALLNPADAAKPDGSRIPIQVETGSSATGDPTHALTSGWWGHEGGGNNGTGTGSTFLSLDASNGTNTVDDTTLAATLLALGAPDLDHIGYAIVPTTSNGSNEDPAVVAGQNAAEVFNAGGAGRVLYLGFGGAMNGSTLANDSVTVVSSKSEVEAWVAAGRPLQTFNNNLQMVDVSSGNVSLTPQGKSILNAWPAGTNLSLVAFVTNGMDPDLDNQVPLVADDGSGKAKTAWMPFTTVGKPGNALRTSAGYQVAGAYAPTITATATSTSTGTSLKATIKNKANGTATDATGTLQFAQVIGGVDQTPTSVPVSGGAATLSLSGFTTGSRTYDITYVPDAPAQATYLTSAPKRVTVNPTTVSLSITGGSTSDTLKATVSPKTAGKVSFKDGTTTIGTATVSTSTGIAQYKKLLSAKKHTITATFTPTNTSYTVSTASKSVYKPTISITKSPSTVRHGTSPKLTIKVVATGTSVSGTIKVTYDPASGSTKTYTLTLSGGAKTFTLPKAVAGTTKITVTYNGHSPVLAATKTYSYKVT